MIYDAQADYLSVIVAIFFTCLRGSIVWKMSLSAARGLGGFGETTLAVLEDFVLSARMSSRLEECLFLFGLLLLAAGLRSTLLAELATWS